MIEVGGHRLHVVCRGSGTPPILLESGIAASSVSWALIQPQLARLSTVCAYDRAGFAWSDPPSRRRTFDVILDELNAVHGEVDAAAPGIVVGHSFGSLIALGYASRWPDRVAGLVLIDPPTEWIHPGQRQVWMLRAARYLSRLGALVARLGLVRVALSWLTGGKPERSRRVAHAFGPGVATTLERIIGEVRKLPEELHPVIQEHWCQPKCFHAMADHLLVLEREAAAISGMAPPPDIPVVVISGSHQPPGQIAAHGMLAARSSHGRHVVASQSGHWILFDEPELIVSAVQELVLLTRRAAPPLTARLF
jgi:pimeloyl-ACP methyl ester carboxylesterase